MLVIKLSTHLYTYKYRAKLIRLTYSSYTFVSMHFCQQSTIIRAASSRTFSFYKIGNYKQDDVHCQVLSFNNHPFVRAAIVPSRGPRTQLSYFTKQETTHQGTTGITCWWEYKSLDKRVPIQKSRAALRRPHYQCQWFISAC